MGWLKDLRKCFKAGGLERTVWAYVPGEAGMQWAAWYGEKAAPHGPTGGIFTVAGAGPWGLNGHVNGAPSETGTHPDFNFTDIALVGRPNASGTDQYTAHGFLKIPDGGGYIVARNRNTGETGRVFLGKKDDCCNARMGLIVEQNTNTSSVTNTGLLEDPYPVDGGECPVYFEMSDLSAFSGGQFQFSTSPDGPFTNIDVCQARGRWVPRQVHCDYVLLEGETWNAPVPCCPTPYLEAGGGALPEGWECVEVCAIVGYVTVDFRGNVVRSCGDPVVEKTDTGLYNITAPAGAETSNAWAIVGEPENNNRNDVRAHFSSSFTTGDFHIEQQSGNGQWQEVDKPFTIQWYGKRKQVVCQ